MKKKIAVMSIALAAIVPMTNVFADDVTTISTDTSNNATQQIPEGNRDQIRVQLQSERDQIQQQREQIQGERQQINAQEQANKQQNIQDRCQRIQSRLTEKLTQVQNNKQNFGIAFTDMKARLQRLSDRLAAKNIDVTKLNQDIATLTSKIDKLNQDHDAFLTGLQASITQAPQACGTSQGQFMSTIASSRSMALTVEKDRLDIRSFFQSTIKPDLMAIRSQIEKKSSSTASSATTSTTGSSTDSQDKTSQTSAE